MSRRAYMRNSRLFRPSERADYAFRPTTSGQAAVKSLFKHYQSSPIKQAVRYMAAARNNSHWDERKTALHSLIYAPMISLKWQSAEQNDPFPHNTSECFKHATGSELRLYWLQLYKYALKAHTSRDRLINLKVLICALSFKLIFHKSKTRKLNYCC